LGVGLLAVALRPRLCALRVAGLRERLVAVTFGRVGAGDREIPLLGSASVSAQGRECTALSDRPVAVVEQVSAEAGGAAGSRLKRQRWCRQRRHCLRACT
jgi:hypothetical protein